MELDLIDKEILNIIQWDFPLVQRPFEDIGRKVDLSEDEVLQRIKAMKDGGIIRQINAIFDTRMLKYKSALVAMSIDPEKLEYVANEINKHPGVSHNYERDHEFNLWFTLAVPPYGNIQDEVEKFSKLGVKRYRILPTIKLYKIGVRLDMVNDDLNPKPTDKPRHIENVPFEITEREKEFIRELQREIEFVKEPFLKPAQRLGVSVDELLNKARYYERIGIMRRFAAILKHRNAGFVANGMIVWNVPEDKIDEVGMQIAAFPQVSHCYRRPVYPDWKYNLFSMVHARTKEACETIASEISKQVKITDYAILFSLREFKKERVKYFEEETIASSLR